MAAFVVLFDIKRNKKGKYTSSFIKRSYIVTIITILLLFICNNVRNNSNIYIIDKNHELYKEDLEYIKQLNPKRMYNTSCLGSELIYHNILCFFDGRMDLYDNTILEECYLIETEQISDISSFIKKYNFDYAIVSNEVSKHWESCNIAKKLYEKNNIIIYEIAAH